MMVLIDNSINQQGTDYFWSIVLFLCYSDGIPETETAQSHR